MDLRDSKITIRSVTESDLPALWKVAYDEHLEWTKWDGPYFNDPIYTEDNFVSTIGPKYYLNCPNRGLIMYDGKIIGIITYSFEDGKLQQWIEFGLVIYHEDYWNQGIGYKVSKMWLDYIFTNHPTLPHIGFTTWSGNHRMMGLGEKLGMKREATIRQVRYYEGQYWDSIKYGILRDEFYCK